jgi:hypothetical protein
MPRSPLPVDKGYFGALAGVFSAQRWGIREAPASEIVEEDIMASSLLPSEGAVGWAATANNAISAPQIDGFRLTLTSGTPVTTSDVTGATVVYLTPFVGDRICLFDGVTSWSEYSSGEISLTLSGLTSGYNYDLFVYDSGGNVTFDTPVQWNGDALRATALVRQNGVWVKTGATTRRYVGTIRATGATTTEDSRSNRLVWNMANRTRRHLWVGESTANWNYSTASYRQVNNSTSNQVAYVAGLSEDLVTADALALCSNSLGQVVVAAGIGLDSSTSNSAEIFGAQTSGNTQYTGIHARYKGYPGVGYHQLRWLEYAQAAGTTTWYGASTYQQGLVAEVFA